MRRPGVDRVIKGSVLGVTLVAVALVCAGCSRKESVALAGRRNGVAKLRETTAAATETNAHPVFVSCKGRHTNLVYSADDYTRLRYGSGRMKEEELARECAASPANADLWFLRAMEAGSTSNQVSWLRKAVELAPDAVLPRIMLAQALPVDGSSGEAREVLTTVFARVTSPSEIHVWVQAAMGMAGNSVQRGSEWLDQFLVHSSNALPARFARMDMASWRQDHVAMVEAAREVLATSNDQYRAATIAMLKTAKQFAGRLYSDEANPGLDQLIDAYGTPFEKLTDRLGSLTRSARRDRGIALCREAMHLATNAEMRVEAASILAEDNDLMAREQTNMEALLVEALGSDGWSAKGVDLFVAKLYESGNTTAVLRLLKLSTGYLTNTPSFALSVLAPYYYGDDMSETSGGPDLFETEGSGAGRLDLFRLEVAERVRALYPTNETVLRALARVYAEGGLFDDELACRTTALAFASSPGRKAADAAALIGRLVKKKELDAARHVADQYRCLASSNAALAAAVGTCLRAAGRTNDSSAFLLGCCATMPAEERQQLLCALLERHGLDRATVLGAVKIAREEVRKDERSTAMLTYPVFNALVKLKQCDEALAFATERLRAGDPVYNMNALLDIPGGKEGLAALVHQWLAQGGSTQQQVNTTMAYLCGECGFEREALDLNLRALRACTSSYQIVCAASQLLNAADRFDDKKQAEEVAVLLDKAMTDPAAGLEWLRMLCWRLEGTGLEERVHRWFDVIWERTTNKPAAAIEAAEFCMAWGRTSMVRTILAEMDTSTALPLQKQWEMHRLLDFTGDKDRAARLRTGLKSALTNAEAIARYGSQFLNLLDDERRDGSAEAEAEIRSLALGWVRNQDLDMYERLNLCDWLRGRKDAALRIELLEQLRADAASPGNRGPIESRLIEEYFNRHDTGAFFRIASEVRTRPGTDRYTIGNLAGKYEELGMYAEAVVLLEQLRADAEDTDTDLLGKTAELYLKMNERDQAIGCIEEAAKAIPADAANAYCLKQLADLFRKAGEPQKGLALLLAAFKECAEADAACDIADTLLGFAREAELALDAAQIADTLLAVERNAQTLKAAAAIAFDMGTLDRAKQLVAEALQLAGSDREKTPLLEQAARIAEATSNHVDRLAALEQLLASANRYTRGDVQTRIVDALLDAGEFSRAAQKAKEFLADTGGSRMRSHENDELRDKLATALRNTGDTEGAWQVAQQFTGSDKYLEEALTLGKTNEAVARFEQETSADDLRQRTAAFEALLDVYGRTSNTAAMASLADKCAALAGSKSAADVALYARVLDQAGRKGDAAEVLMKAYGTATEEQKDETARNIFTLLCDAGREKEAAAWLDGQPQEPAILSLKAQACARQGNTADAVRLCCDALDGLDAGDESGQSGCLNGLKGLMDGVQDKELVDTAVARLWRTGDARDAKLHEYVAGLYEVAERFDEACGEYQKAAGFASDDDAKRNCMEEYAQVCIRAEEYDKAIATYRSLLDNTQLDWSARDKLRTDIADVYEKSRKPQGVTETYREDIKDCEDHIRAMGTVKDVSDDQFRLVELYGKVGDGAEAVRVLQKLADDRPGTPVAARALEELKRYRGK